MSKHWPRGPTPKKAKQSAHEGGKWQRESGSRERMLEAMSAFAPAPGSALFLFRYAIAALVRAAWTSSISVTAPLGPAPGSAPCLAALVQLTC